jgi:hypothetical protein
MNEVFIGIIALVLVGISGALVYRFYFGKWENEVKERGLSREGLLPLESYMPPLSSHAVNRGLPHFVSTVGVPPNKSEQGDGGIDVADVVVGAIVIDQLWSDPPENPTPAAGPEHTHSEEPAWTHHEHLDSAPEPSSYSYDSGSNSDSTNSSSSDSSSSDSGGGD